MGRARGDKPGTASDAVNSDAPSSGLRVLLVDDDDTLRTLIKNSLVREGYVITEAGSGEAALRRIDVEIPDLVVLDFMMAKLSGLDVLKALRSSPRTARLPVLMLTGMGDEKHLREAFDAGATDYITKPFSTPQLTARIHACLARSAKQ